MYRVLKSSLIGCLLFLSVVSPKQALAQINFNIEKIAADRPYSKRFGDVWGEDNIACLGIWLDYAISPSFGVGVYDISDPSNPIRQSIYVASNSGHNQFEQGVVRNKIGYFASWSGGGVHIVSLTDPASPQRLSIIDSSKSGFNVVHTLFLERDYLYEAAHSNNEQRVKVFDVSDPLNPVFLQDIQTTNTHRVHQITTGKKGGRTILYTSGWGTANGSYQGQTDIWDVTDVSTHPALWLGRIYSGFASHSSWPTEDGNSLVVCRETSGGEVTIYDISDPKNPTAQSVITPASIGLPAAIPHNPVIVSNILFLSWYQNGIQVFDISDRTRPVRIGAYDTYLTSITSDFQGNWGVYPFLGLDKVLLSDIQSGLWIMDASDVLTASNRSAPLLIKSPVSQLVDQGSSVTFTADFTGSPLSYEWRLNGYPIPGATNSSYIIPNAQPEHSGAYTVRAFNDYGSVVSAAANLSLVLSNEPPIITAHPESVLAYPEQSVTFSVSVLGGAPLSYFWRFNDKDIPGATNSSYTIPKVQMEHAGGYNVIVLNPYGSVLSAKATLSLIDSPYINGITTYPAIHNAIISWNTTVPADAQVDFGPVSEGSITGSSPRNNVLSTNHSVLITGLQPGTTYNFQVRSRANGTNFVSTVYQFTTDIILDNMDPEVTYTGAWNDSTSALDFFGENYRWASGIGANVSPSSTATFTPFIPVSGNYDVFTLYSAGSNRATNAPFSISHRDGNTLVRIDQTINSGQWNLLASGIPFSVGTSGYIRLGNNSTSGKVVVVDAIRLSYSPGQPVPVETDAPAWWTKYYFDGPVDPAIDHDGDGYTTWEEYLLGTDPNSAEHSFDVKVFRSGGTVNVLFHPLHAGRVYRLERRPNLNSGAWEPVDIGFEPAGPDGHGVFSLPLNGEAEGFYRVSVAFDTEPLAVRRAPVTQTERRMFIGTFTEPGCGPNRIYAQ